MKIACVIPEMAKNKENAEMTLECLDSFAKYHIDAKDVVLVDDGSFPQFRDLLQAECSKRGVHFLANEVNSGFPKTCNKGINFALDVLKADVVVIINNDIVFTQEVLSEFAKAFEINDRIGIVGSLLFYPDGTIQHGGMVMPKPKYFLHRGWHQTLQTAPEALKSEYLIGVTGALFGMKAQMLKEIGGFNDDYFLAFDDTELCMRAWTNDWRIYYSADIRAIHKEGATRGRTDHEKLAKHRLWYVKEMETMKKFMAAADKINFSEIESKVALANAERLGHRIAGAAAVSVVAEVAEAVSVAADDRITQAKNIVVKRAGALGDVILTTSIVRNLKILNQSASITVVTVCPDAYLNNPHVSRVVPSLNGVDYDLLIDLDMAYEWTPKRSIVDSYAMKAFGHTHFATYPEMYSSEKDSASLLSKFPQVSQQRVAVVHMGISWPSRTWPRHKWMEVSKSLAASGYKVLVVGRGGDYRSDLFAGVINAVDQLSIAEIREACKLADVFVGIDSGLLHVAQTTSVPIVGLFTVANPEYRLVRRASRSIGLVPKVECRFCLHEQAPPVTNVTCKYGSNHCLLDINSTDVVNAVREIAR